MSKYDEKTLKRFWDKVNIQAIGCWEWNSTTRGTFKKYKYGCFWYKGKFISAHRFSYELLKNDIPEGLVIDHLCNNTLCVNPEHLKVTTQRENILRSQSCSGVNVNKTHCRLGHEFTEDNTYLYKNHRHCKECKRQNLRNWRKKEKEVVAQ